MPVLLEDTKKQVEALLVTNELIDAETMEKLHEEAKKQGEPFFQLLVTGQHISSEDLTKAIAQITRVPYVNLSAARVNPKVLSLLPQEIAERYMAVPLGEMQNRLVVAMLDASNVQAVDFLSNKIGRPLKVYMASQEGIESVIKQYGVDVTKDVEKALDQKDADDAANAPKEKNIQTIVQDSPISKALAAIMEYAAKSRASDIHIEPLEKELKIRCRIDGVLREIMKLPKATEPALISRIKIL